MTWLLAGVALAVVYEPYEIPLPRVKMRSGFHLWIPNQLLAEFIIRRKLFTKVGER